MVHPDDPDGRDAADAAVRAELAAFGGQPLPPVPRELACWHPPAQRRAGHRVCTSRPRSRRRTSPNDPA